MSINLFGQHFYFKTMRRITSAFGSLFNDIQILRYNKTTGAELERMVVPLMYGQKEKFITRNVTDPNLLKSIQTSLPRMSFEMSGISYDSSRKQSNLVINRAEGVAGANTAKKQYVGVPYNLEFGLSIYTRNIEDGAQIVEQILPIFKPDFTLNLDIVDSMNIRNDVPIIFNGINYSVENEGSGEDLRLIYWDLNFTVKAFFYGPVIDTKIIQKANTYIYDSSATVDKNTVIILQIGGFETFKEKEYVFQGSSLEDASVKGEVIYHDTENEKLYLKNVVGLNSNPGAFKANTEIMGYDSRAKWNVSSFYNSTPGVALRIGYVQGSPANSNLSSNFSYNSAIIDFPETIVS